MNILMLGHSGVGKTTYMASMYALLQTPIDGFSVKAQSDIEHNQLIQMANNIKHSRYPAPTDQRSKYQFSLNFQGKSVLDFDWVDYRGGALRDRKDTVDSEQLVKDINESEVVIMFCDSQSILNGTAKREIDRMTQLVGRAAAAEQSALSIGIVYTKADLFGNKLTLDDPRLLQPIQELMNIIKASNNVSGTLMAVACGAKSASVELPVLFALRFGVVIRALILQHYIEELLKERERLHQERGTLGGLFGEVLLPIFGEKNRTQLANEAFQEAAKLYQIFEPLVEPANGLVKYLEKLPSF